MQNELFITDEQAVVHIEGTEEFNRCWKIFLSKKREVIRSLSPLMTVEQKYATTQRRNPLAKMPPYKEDN
jgi:hypothetical protein